MFSVHVHCVEYSGFESHPRQLMFLRKTDCLGCTELLLCLVVCLNLLASFFLPSHLALKNVHEHVKKITQIFIYFSKPFRLLYSLIIYEIVNFLLPSLLLSFFLSTSEKCSYTPDLSCTCIYMYVYCIIII